MFGFFVIIAAMALTIFYFTIDRSEVFTVCNSCGKDIAIIEKNQAKELLKQGSWR